MSAELSPAQLGALKEFCEGMDELSVTSGVTVQSSGLLYSGDDLVGSLWWNQTDGYSVYVD